MPNTKDADLPAHHRIILAGPTGSGKSAQLWTLPGRKFAYIFDPNTMQTVRGLDLDYEPFMPEMDEMDATLKGFNQGSKSDKPKKQKEPTLYMRWVDDINDKAEKGFFGDYQWLAFDSMTFLAHATMARQLWINGRYGDIEDRGDWRVVGNKLSDVFTTIAGLPINILATVHLQTYQDEKTKRIQTQLQLPGRARGQFPLIFTDVLSTFYEDEHGKPAWFVRTKPDPRGLQDIRTSIRGLETVEDVTIRDWNDPELHGIGALLKKGS